VTNSVRRTPVELHPGSTRVLGRPHVPGDDPGGIIVTALIGMVGAVVGGFVYRGGYYPTLHGYYFFTDNRTGSIWALKRDAKGLWLRSAPLADLNYPTTFGEGYDGELYVATYLEGRIYQIQGPEPERGFLPLVGSAER